jgi:hypothetical protein
MGQKFIQYNTSFLSTDTESMSTEFQHAYALLLFNYT